jgi:uncharacterized protein
VTCCPARTGHFGKWHIGQCVTPRTYGIDVIGSDEENAAPKPVDGIAKAHFEGVPAMMLHCSTHSCRAAKTDEWRKCVGQTSMSHEKNRDLKVRNVAQDHPVVKGFPKEWLDPKDELYKNEKLWDNFKPLATAYGEDTKKDHHVIWVNEYGKAKVFGTTLGHGNHTMQDPVYLDLVARGLLWACGKLDDSGKPLPGYESKQK